MTQHVQINKTGPINNMNNKYVIISMAIQKTIDKSQHSYMIKYLKKLITQRIYPCKTQDIYNKSAY